MDKSENFFNNMVPKENPDEPVINDNENTGDVIDEADLEGLFDSNSQILFTLSLLIQKFQLSMRVLTP